MKTLIIILLPLSMSAQLTLTNEQVKFNYEKIELGRMYRDRGVECETEFDNLIREIGKLRDSIHARNVENASIRSENRGLVDESNKLSYDSGVLNEKIKEAGAWWNKWYTYAVAAVSFYLGTQIK